MGLITNRSCFTGFYFISQTCYDKLDQYIDAYEETFLENLLGCGLFDLFKADLDADPSGTLSEQRFIDIFDKFCIESDSQGSLLKDCNKQYISHGMKDMVTGYIYFMYNRDYFITSPTVGKMVNAPEDGENVHGALLAADNYERWNRAIETYKSIQYFICKNRVDYPEYRGVDKDYMFYGGAI